MPRLVIFALFAVLLSTTLACSHRLSAANSPDEVELKVGTTTKREVSNLLGLPSTRKVIGEYEQWGYVDGPALSNLIVPVSTGSGFVTTTPIAIDAEEDVAVVYVFDLQGILVETRDLREK